MSGLSDVEKLHRFHDLGYKVTGTAGVNVTVQHPTGREVNVVWSVFTATPVAKLLSRIDRIVRVGA